MRTKTWVQRLGGGVLLACLLQGLAGPANADLLGRDLDGNPANGYEAYYDTVQNLTWLTDSKAMVTSNWAVTSGAGGQNDYLGNGEYWVKQLNVNGITGWRLPTVTATMAVNYGALNVTFSELANLYAELGNSAGTPLQAGPFLNLTNAAASYWTSTRVMAPDEPFPGGPGYTFLVSFDFSTGSHSATRNFSGSQSWAVHDGDVLSPVPEASSTALMLFGLGAVGAAIRRRQAPGKPSLTA